LFTKQAIATFYKYRSMLVNLAQMATTSSSLQSKINSHNLTILLLPPLRRTPRIRLGLLAIMIMRMATKLLLRSKPILAGFRVDLGVAQERKLLGCFDVGHVLNEALGEDDVDFFERTVFGLRVEDVNDWEEAGVYSGEEEVCAWDSR
jgi:hypothetical protein